MKILIISDDGIASGYGRISMEVNARLQRRGVELMAASIYYDGLLPPTNEGKALPYWVASLAGKPDWVAAVVNLIGAYQPDVIMVIQDAPYAQQIRSAPIDWSRYALVVITPVDGAPVYAPWVDMLKQADGVLSISQFGVDTHRKAGIHSELCRPGIDPDAFFPMNADDRRAVRQKLGIDPDAFVAGSMCMNQGRKDIPAMLEAFFAFASDKPTARYLLDMEATSPAGWDVPALCQQNGWDAGKLLFRDAAFHAGITSLRERYNLLDAHMVISHREGYGLPLAEAMACGVVSIALDYCSGTEICGDGRGVLVKAIDYASVSTWGGALDKHPDTADLTTKLQMLYDNPDEKRAIARRGMAWARQQTWDRAADAVHGVLERVMAIRKQPAPAVPVTITPPQNIPVSNDGMMTQELALVE